MGAPEPAGRSDPTTRVPMRRLPAAEARSSLAEVVRGYSREEAEAEARRTAALHLELSAAALACPFFVPVDAMVTALAEGRWEDARAAVETAHPWPGILGRSCHKFCERALARQVADPARLPNVSALERAVGDLTAPPDAAPGPAVSGRIAVVGAGGAGLGCAFEARRLGHDVELYDALPFPGGKLVTGYPPFRMDKAIVAREADAARWGVRLHLGTRVDWPLLRCLLAERDGVLLAVGRARPRSLDLPGGDAIPHRFTGEAFLARCWTDGVPADVRARPVVIVGGGNTSVDVARTVLRLGGRPVITYRGAPEDAPMRPSQRDRYLSTLAEEGAEVLWHAEPVQAFRDSAGTPAVRFRRTGPHAAEPDAVLRCDVLVSAIGVLADLEGLLGEAAGEMAANGDGGPRIAVDPVTRLTSLPRLWAGGDVAGTHAQHGAFLDGMMAARAMHAALSGDLDGWVAGQVGRGAASPAVTAMEPRAGRRPK